MPYAIVVDTSELEEPYTILPLSYWGEADKHWVFDDEAAAEAALDAIPDGCFMPKDCCVEDVRIMWVDVSDDPAHISEKVLWSGDVMWPETIPGFDDEEEA